MESLSRPFHRRKLPTVNGFSGKNAYDGVLSGHRPKFDGSPVVKVEEYGEIFGSNQADSSIPVLDLSTLVEASDDFNSEIWSTKPDYGMIFGGFRDQDIAICYEELMARDKARAHASSSVSQSSRDLGDMCHQPLDALQQFNMLYNKISQRSKDGLDGTKHVTQLHDVPGFTCFVNESPSQPKKKTENQKSFVNKWDFPEKQTSQGTVEFKSRLQDDFSSDDRILKTFEADLKPHPSEVLSPPAASQPNKDTGNQKSYITTNMHTSVNSSKVDLHEKQTSQSAVESRSKYQDESLSDDRIFKTFEADLKSHPSKVSSPPPAASQPNKKTENQKSCITNNIHPTVNSSIGHEKQTSQTAVESSRLQDEGISDDRILKTFEADLKPHSSKVSSPPAASQPNKESENQKSYTTTNIHPTVNSSKGDFHEKQTSQSAVESRSRLQDEALTDDRILETSEAALKSHPSKVSSPPAASQPNKLTENQKSYITNNIHPSVNSSKGDFHEKQTLQSAVESRSRLQDEALSDDRTLKTFEAALKSHPSKISSPSAASQPNKESENQKSYITTNILPSVNSSKGDFHEKQTSQSAVESGSRYQDESLSGDGVFRTFEVEFKPHPCKVSSPPADSQPNQESENQKSYITNNVHLSVNSSKEDFHKKQTSQTVVESGNRYGQGEFIFDDRNFKEFQADLTSHPPKVSSSSPAASATNFDNHKDYQKRSEATYGEFPPTCFEEELDVNSAAAVSLAALKKAIGKAQESIRIAKESVGRKKGIGGFSSKSFKDSLKVKAKVANVDVGEENKEKDEKMKAKDHRHGSTVVFSHFVDGENLFGAKKVMREQHGNISESGMNSEIPIRSPFELRENVRVCNPKEVVGKIEPESTENNTCEGPQKDVEKPNDFLVLESCEKKLGDTELNLTMHQKVEGEKKIPEKSNEIGYVKKFSEVLFGLFESNKQENLEEENDEKVASAVSQFEDEREVKDEGDFYNVCDIGIETNDFSQKENESHNAEETWKTSEKIQVPETYENSSSDHDDAEESKSVISASQNVDDTEEAYKVDQNDKNAESSQEIDDVSRSISSSHEFQVEDTEAIEKEMIENISSNETKEKNDECDAKSDDLANCGLADMDFVHNYYSIERNDFSRTEDHEISERENHNAKETWEKLDTIEVPKTYENSSNDYNDAEESESVIGASQIVDDGNNNAESSQDIDNVSSSSSDHDFQVENTEALEKEDCKVDQDDNNTESSQEIDDIQVEDTEALEKEMIENIASDETEDIEDECDAKSDDMPNCGLADVDFVQNDVQSESSSDTILGLQIEVNEYKEREETVEKDDNHLQQSHEETPEIRTKVETGTQQEPDDASRESEPSITVDKAQNKEEMEQERIKLAVERAIREVRERAFAEVRQRVIADTQEKVTKASSDKTFAQSKLKAERAAVERATAEARQRALEKAISQKKNSEPKIQVIEINQTTSATNHTNTESALRSKAKLEKDNRIMERAAKALAEKEKRDLLVLREQAERSRLAENLDADIKRWSNGKEGNLRALLSTLQYILGADSGWQPVPLTDIITTGAVKKAYRKATLCVHPDKLQQRGANIQQKYICEKVFDLLKAAWNRFNSEER